MIGNLRTWSWVRWAIIALALVVVWMSPMIYRHARFLLTGTAWVDGLQIYLLPDDPILTPQVLNQGEWEAGETAEFRRLIRPGDTVVDVGAHIGWYTLLAASRVGPSGRVIAFEPGPSALAYLRKNVATNHLANVTIEPMAISDHAGTIALPDGPRTFEVHATPLDDYLRDKPGEIGLVKIDIEGMEGLALAGMRRTLRENPPRAMIVEITPHEIRRTGLDPQQVAAELLDAGYRARALNVYTGATFPLQGASMAEMLRQMEAARGRYDFVFERGPGS
jgi:FkbM family methyltransferase